MKMKSKILFVTILALSLLCAHFTTSYIPEQTLVIGQVVVNATAVENTNLEVGIFIKNYFNYTITNITVSLNFAESAPLTFNSSLLGQLINGNVTLNSTIQTPLECDFTPVNITDGFMTEDYLEFNITQLEPNTSMIFYYNLTSDSVIEISIPYADLTYYDNWGDPQETHNRNRILVSFISADSPINTVLPQWNLGKSISAAWAWVIFALVPAVIAGLSAFLLYFRRR
ncbi:MAG: hypothetical protein KAU62_14900 [Candidatus Heimdallarchaeota archaeon]|nr:hypothetical protein [Candidatus Heimdallarchaeota archaeon]MCG3257388.1 hypothetical protein [Candidatus Heimdallarchaeota archaeon]MCK4612441.1 hypothetical protein [Candidatus Heimdallarchaeota archaeon]